MIEAAGLVKRFGELTAVDSLSFSVAEGECLGFLGPNGAGKTTTIRMICGQAPMDEGRITVGGIPVDGRPRDVRAMLGVCPQEDNLDTDFAVEENLLLYASYFGIGRRTARERAGRLLTFVQLADRRTSPIESLSGGMKRRLLLARSLINEPSVLVLDEPTTGLDPQVRQVIWAALRELKGRGMTILLTTHYMEEAAQLADRVGILDRGRLIEEGSPAELIERTLPAYVLEFEARELDEGAPPDGALVERHGDRAYVFHDEESRLRSIIGEVGLGAAQLRPTSLEDVFLALTGRGLDE